jgi:hypothetical protein
MIPMIPMSGHRRLLRRDRPVLDEQEAFSCESPKAGSSAVQPAELNVSPLLQHLGPLLQHSTARFYSTLQHVTRARHLSSLRQQLRADSCGPKLRARCRLIALYSLLYSTLQPAL